VNDLPRELRLHRPAEVVHRTAIPNREIFIAPRHARHQLVAQTRKLEARGDLRILASGPRWSDAYGQWELPVQWLRLAPPWWRRKAFIATAIVSVLGSLAGIGYWVLTSLAAMPLALFCGSVFFGLVILVRLGRRPHVKVTQIVEVR
jgi:hypothetical protein